jgi:hypothetical protein
MARLTSFLAFFVGLAALCTVRALAVAEFCPATIGPAHQVKDGGGTLYSTTLGAEAPRSVTADVEAQTENGWYQFSIPETAIVQQAARYRTSQLTFTRNESSSTLLYVRFPQGAGNVIRWWITDAISSGDSAMGWDEKGKVGCSPYAQGSAPAPDPAMLKQYQGFVAERLGPPLLDYDRMPGTGDAVLTIAPAVAQELSCDKPFSNSTVSHPVSPAWPLTYTTAVALQTLVRVDVNPDGSVVDAWVFQPSGIRAFDNSAVDAARRSTYTAGRAFCEPAPGIYLFRALFTP